MYKIIIKTDSQPYDRSLLPAADVILLGSTNGVFVFDLGDYRESQEFAAMHKLVMGDG